VIPVILRPVDWRATPFGKLQALPKDGKPVTTFENLDSALEQVAQGIRRAINGLQEVRRVPIARYQNAVSPVRALPASSLDPIAKLLAVYIGPIASVVVRHAASHCYEVWDLCEAVAAEIANPNDRSRFLSEARRVSASAAID